MIRAYEVTDMNSHSYVVRTDKIITDSGTYVFLLDGHVAATFPIVNTASVIEV